MNYKLSKNENTEIEVELFCIKDIKAKNDEEYSEEVNSLPLVIRNYSISIKKKKVEPAGFMFYVKYEIPILKGQKKKCKENKHIIIDELFLYKDKINYLNEIKIKNGGGEEEEEEEHTDDDQIGKYKKERSTKNQRGNKYDDYDDYDDDMNNMNSNSKKKQEKTNNKKSSNLVKKCINNNINVYEILSVDEADDLEAIKSSYKKLILLFHPDKNKGTNYLNQKEKEKKKKKEREKGKDKGGNDNPEIKKDLIYYMEKYNIEKLTPEEKKTMFLKIQDSYAVLSDKTLRKQYDSSIPFDEHIPTLTELEEAPNFYEFLRPVFKRNAKWSAKKPVPDIGDENTNIKNVKYFYDFWYNFINWRDFSYQNEYDYEEAECREERRWMERENKKIQKKASKAENLRIIKLVDLAYNNDPRILAENKRLKLEKQKKKELAILEKQKKTDTLMTELEKENTNNQHIAANNDKKNKDNKAAVKIWKHHIKSLCITKLSKYIDSDLVQEQLALMPFETLCEFIYDIYICLNFNFQKADIFQAEKSNSSMETPQKQQQGKKESINNVWNFKNGNNSAENNSNNVNEKFQNNVITSNQMHEQSLNAQIKKQTSECIKCVELNKCEDCVHNATKKKANGTSYEAKVTQKKFIHEYSHKLNEHMENTDCDNGLMKNTDCNNGLVENTYCDNGLMKNTDCDNGLMKNTDCDNGLMKNTDCDNDFMKNTDCNNKNVDKFVLEKNKQDKITNGYTSNRTQPIEVNNLHHNKTGIILSAPCYVVSNSSSTKKGEEQKENNFMYVEKIPDLVHLESDDSKRSTLEKNVGKNNATSSTACSTASSSTNNQTNNRNISHNSNHNINFSSIHSVTNDSNNKVTHDTNEITNRTHISKDVSGIKTTGFIGHLKNVELGDKDIELLIIIFKKYINEFTHTTDKEKKRNNTDKSLNLKNKIETDSTCIPKQGIVDKGSSKTDIKVNENAKVMKNQVSTNNHCENDKKKNDESSNNTHGKWTIQEVSLLAKALKSYPGGTRNRWELIANYIKTKSVKEVIKKTKEMFENETLKNLSKNFEDTPFDNFKNQNKGVMKKIDDNLDKREIKIEPVAGAGTYEGANLTNNIGDNTVVKRPWTYQEQHLLEQALMKYPSSLPKRERLELVASEIKTRTLDEVILRMKTLRAQILAKKAAK
ncbi:DNA-binding chaperone [Plasmodium gonderi]|uniref:DNA-binding chaperone n=1 Tax=Plasmodium gonderi TaxID=77519 RepID=A0A1Y1JMT2_PLAGO|nr:DNA-binding chaperone [Plasmodium gonderi]GAW83550.1 DNA-binding chaperone [Plasmodium gonderi]